MKKILHAVLNSYRFYVKKIYPSEFNVLTDLLPNDKYTLIDVGAHAGAWACNLSKKYPLSRIIAIEALPYYADVLKITCKITKCKNVFVLNNALTDRSGFLKVKDKDKNGKRLAGFTHIVSDSYEEGVTVRSICLDDLQSEISLKVAFLKCDIEGYEYFAFKGGKEIITKFKPLILSEINTEWCTRYKYSPEDLFTFFYDLGYESFLVSGSGKLLEPVIYRKELFVNGDYIFKFPDSIF